MSFTYTYIVNPLSCSIHYDLRNVSNTVDIFKVYIHISFPNSVVFNTKLYICSFKIKRILYWNIISFAYYQTPNANITLCVDFAYRVCLEKHDQSPNYNLWNILSRPNLILMEIQNVKVEKLNFILFHIMFKYIWANFKKCSIWRFLCKRNLNVFTEYMLYVLEGATCVVPHNFKLPKLFFSSCIYIIFFFK